jgi:type IV fimbrial biogenesis protein FimT
MPIKRQNQMGQPGQTGFTLVELMVVVAVIAILAVIAAPGMTAMINNGRATGQAEELVTSMQLARAEAVRRNARVTICASTDGASCASTTTWSSWIIHGMDYTDPTSPVDDVIRNNTANGSVLVSGPAAGIVFKPSGMVDSSQNIEVTMSSEKRCITVLVSGLVSTTKAACS